MLYNTSVASARGMSNGFIGSAAASVCFDWEFQREPSLATRLEKKWVRVGLRLIELAP